MPKGVEHRSSPSAKHSPRFVPNSVMPKGVEHFKKTGVSKETIIVPNSVMPKGVEHSGSRGTSALRGRAEFSDAERR